jgi:hypothetical protein
VAAAPRSSEPSEDGSRPILDDLEPWLRTTLALISQRQNSRRRSAMRSRVRIVWTVIASWVEICKLNGVNPHAYLNEVITKIVNGYPNSRINELLP